MFGPDTSLVMDAFQMAALAVIAGGGAIYLLLHRSKGPTSEATNNMPNRLENKLDLEKRVRILERIATDSSTDLSDEIETLREITPEPTTPMEGTTL